MNRVALDFDPSPPRAQAQIESSRPQKLDVKRGMTLQSLTASFAKSSMTIKNEQHSQQYFSWFSGYARKLREVWQRSPYFARYAGFLSMEAGYLAFATAATLKPIPFPPSANDYETLVKGAMTTVAVAWQTIALVPVYGILDFIYSSEWCVVRRAGGGSLHRAARPADRISVLTSSWIDRARYAKSGSTSTTFRLCFIGALLIFALSGIAPSTIFVAPLLQGTTRMLDVAKITIHGDLGNGTESTPAIQASRRATAILRQEWLNRYTMTVPYGFSANENALIPWPPQSLLTMRPNSNVTYGAWVARFNHSCVWYQPIWDTPSGAVSHVLDGQSTWTIPSSPYYNWTVWMTSNLTQTYVSGVFPLVNATRTEQEVSAFLFLGGNSSVYLRSESHKESSGIDLSEIASTYRPTGFPLWKSQVNGSNTNGDGLPKLATILVCTPEAVSSVYNVTVHSGGILSISDRAFDYPDHVAGDDIFTSGLTIFSESLVDALQTIEPHNMPHTTFVNGFAYQLFMSPVYPTPSRSTDHPLVPMDLATINGKMDRFILSASKAYLDGYVGMDAPATTANIPAYFSFQVQAVHGSPPFLYVTIALAAAISLLLFLAISYADTEGPREPFTLEALLQQDELSERASQVELARMDSQSR